MLGKSVVPCMCNVIGTFVLFSFWGYIYIYIYISSGYIWMFDIYKAFLLGGWEKIFLTEYFYKSFENNSQEANHPPVLAQLSESCWNF